MHAASYCMMFWYSLLPFCIPRRLLIRRNCFASLPFSHLCSHSSLQFCEIITFLADFIMEDGFSSGSLVLAIRFAASSDECLRPKYLLLLRIDSYESAGLNTQINHMLLTKNRSSILYRPPSSFRIRRIIPFTNISNMLQRREHNSHSQSQESPTVQKAQYFSKLEPCLPLLRPHKWTTQLLDGTDPSKAPKPRIDNQW